MHLRSRYRMGDIFGAAKVSLFFFGGGGCLKFLIFIFWVNCRCWARAYVCRKNESTPHPLWAWYTVRESDKSTRKHNTHESQDVSPFPAGDHKALRNRID